MTRRILRIATILLIIPSLLFFPAPVSRAQDDITQAERILAQEIADRFMKRLDETGDFATVIDEMYAEDFIERYIQQEIFDGKGVDPSSTISFQPGLEVKRSLLKQATVEDWRRFYIAVNNFVYRLLVVGVNKNAVEMLNGKDIDDETPDKFIPANALALLRSHPILKGFLDLDNESEETQSDAAREESGPKSIETPEEMQDVTETLEEALRLLTEGQDDNSTRLTEAAKSAIAALCLERFKNEGGTMAARARVLDRKYLGLPPGSRIILAITPIFYGLEIVEAHGKYNIVKAELFIED